MFKKNYKWNYAKQRGDEMKKDNAEECMWAKRLTSAKKKREIGSLLREKWNSAKQRGVELEKNIEKECMWTKKLYKKRKGEKRSLKNTTAVNFAIILLTSKPIKNKKENIQGDSHPYKNKP